MTNKLIMTPKQDIMNKLKKNKYSPNQGWYILIETDMGLHLLASHNLFQSVIVVETAESAIKIIADVKKNKELEKGKYTLIKKEESNIAE
jgi:hypothetical protein